MEDLKIRWLGGEKAAGRKIWSLSLVSKVGLELSGHATKGRCSLPEAIVAPALYALPADEAAGLTSIQDFP